MDIGGRVEPVGHHGAVRCRSAWALRGWGGGDEAQTPGATVVRCYKSLPKSILWLRATLTLTFWSRSSLGTYFWAKVNKNQRGAGSPPSSWDLDGGWGGARRHEALITKFVRTARFIVTYHS